MNSLSKVIKVAGSKLHVSRQTFASRLRQYSSTVSNHEQKIALVLGSSGALGSSIVTQLKLNDVVVIGADVKADEGADAESESSIDAFIPMSHEHSDYTVHDLTKLLKMGIDDLFEDGQVVFDAIICANGGFLMDKDSGGDSVTDVHDRMMLMNYNPVMAAHEIANDHMTLDEGLFVAMGAGAALNNTVPGMFGYAASKTAVHNYVQTMGKLTAQTAGIGKKLKRKTDGAALQYREKHPFMKELTIVGILPDILDTVANREAMLEGEDETAVEAITSGWVKPVDIAEEIKKWVMLPDLRPFSGSLVKTVTKNGEADFVIVR